MEIPSIFGALVIIFGLAYWINSRREEKERVAASKEAAKEAKAKGDEASKTREIARKKIHSRTLEFGVEYTDDELGWILDTAVFHSGIKGLEDIGNTFAVAPKDKLEQLMMKIEKDHTIYLAEQQITQLSAEAERKWQALLDNFKKLNPAQQKAHLAYIKKTTDELTDEQLHILELVSLGETSTPKSKDIEVGGVKLFTMKEK